MLSDLIRLHDARPLDAGASFLLQTTLRQTAHVPRPEWGHLPSVAFRYVDDEGMVAFDLSYDSPVLFEGASVTLHKLLEAQWQFEQPSLISAVCGCTSIDEVVRLVKALQVIARFSADLDGTPHAHLVSSAFCVQLIRQMELGLMVASNGDVLLDALTRSLGIRSKVTRLLQQKRRDAAAQPTPREMEQTIRWFRGN